MSLQAYDLRQAGESRRELQRLALLDQRREGRRRRRRRGGNVAVGAVALTGATLPPDDGQTRAKADAPWDFPQWHWSQTQKWSSLDPSFARTVQSLRTRMAAKGWRNGFELIYGWRPWSVQAGLVAAGHSKVSFSRHNVVGEDLRPRAWAVDIRPADKLDKAKLDAFYRDLREISTALGLGSGGWYGVSKSAKKANDRSADLGWDPGHVERADRTLSSLKREVARYYKALGVGMPGGVGGGGGGGGLALGGLALLALLGGGAAWATR